MANCGAGFGCVLGHLRKQTPVVLASPPPHFIHSDKASLSKPHRRSLIVEASSSKLFQANFAPGELRRSARSRTSVRVGRTCSNKNFSKILIPKGLTKVFSFVTKKNSCRTKFCRYLCSEFKRCYVEFENKLSRIQKKLSRFRMNLSRILKI